MHSPAFVLRSVLMARNIQPQSKVNEDEQSSNRQEEADGKKLIR